MPMRCQAFLPCEDATLKVGLNLAPLLHDAALELDAALMVYLEGDLGAGKTTLTRALVQALGHKGVVKSPTFTIVEPYECQSLRIYHFDLYRLADPEELYYLGGRDYFEKGALCLVEWPSKGFGVLPEPHVIITLEHAEEGRKITFENLGLSERFDYSASRVLKGVGAAYEDL